MRIGLEIKKLHMLISCKLRSSTSIKAMDDMTNTHGYILKYLADRDGQEVFQRDIERDFRISRPTASEVLKLMEKNGLIERKSVEYDGRLKRLFLTEKGRSLNGLVRQEFDQFEARLSSMLSEEDEARLEEIIDKLTRGLMDDKKEVL